MLRDRDALAQLDGAVRTRVCCSRGNLLEEYTFSRVFGPETTNAGVFADIQGPRIVRNVLSGYHETFFAYGQTGSPRTGRVAREAVRSVDESPPWVAIRFPINLVSLFLA